MQEYSIERVQPVHYSILGELYADAFGSRISPADIARRFSTTERACEHVGFIAIHNATQTAAAYYGVFPLKISYQGTGILAGLSGDTMTHSQHRMKGLFVTLAKKTFEECKEKNIQVIFGCPNKNSYNGFINKLSWKEVDTLVRYDLKHKFKTLPLSRISQKSNILKKIFFYWCRLLLKKWIINPPEIFNHTPDKGMAIISRDNYYLSYKKDTDKFFIQLNGHLFWIKLTDVLLIGDISDTDHLTKNTIAKLKKLAFLCGYNTISYYLNKTIKIPDALSDFVPFEEIPSCIYFPAGYSGPGNILLTAADFDTW